MAFERIWGAFGLFLLIVVVVDAQTNLPMDIKGNYTCSLHPENQLWLELLAWDVYGNAIRMNAINYQEVEITGCSVTGSGQITTPFYMTSKVRLADDVEVFNVCGMTKTTSVTGSTVYNWRVKAYTYPYGHIPNNADFILNLHCDTGDLTDGRVETILDLEVVQFFVTPDDANDRLGPNIIATDANVLYTAIIYPNGRSVPSVLSNAQGIFLYDCYSANNDLMIGQERFIDNNGCPVAGATYAPTSSFQSVTNTADFLKVEASYARTAAIQNENDIYITCSVGKCTDGNDQYCIDPCAAYRNNYPVTTRVKTGVPVSTSFIVQDKAAHRMATNSGSNPSVELSSADVGDVITLATFNAPGGTGGNSDLLDATGFYVYNCRYSRSPQMTNPTSFIDYFGCTIPNTLLSPASNFAIDEFLTADEAKYYVTRSGPITLSSTGNARLTIQCDTGKCTVEGHNYCKQRCGAVNNFIGGAEDLGYRGHMSSLSILDTVNVRALQIFIQTANGDVVTGTNNPVTVGDTVNFGLEVTPGGPNQSGGSGGPNDNVFVDAKGVFLHSCYATVDGVQTQFIDSNGCSIANSPYRTSTSCRDVTSDGVPPFTVDCGTITVPEEGDVTTECGVMYCTTANNPYCENRCAAGQLRPNSNVVDPTVTTTSQYTARSQTGDVGRTAIKSEELRTTIAAVSAVGAVVFLLMVALITYCVVHSQKGRAKRMQDNRKYDY